MMAQTQVVLDEQDFTCPICLELLEDPIAIPCGHSFCSHCIWQWKFGMGNTGVETFSCPECRATFPSMPLLERNIMLAETVEKLRASTRQQAASPVNTAFPSTATTVMNVQQPSASASVPRNVRHPRASASVSTNVPQPSASVSTNVPQPSASVSTNVPQPSASVSTNVPQPQRASASVSTNVPQPSATVSTNVRQPQRTSASVSTNVRQPSATVSINVRQPQRASASVSTNVRQPSATVSTNVRQPQRTSASVSTNVRQPQRSFASVSRNVRQPSASVSTNVRQPRCWKATDVRWFRVLALLFACVAFSVALHASQVRHHQVGEWCIFCWGFCFIGTAVVLLVELCGLQSRVPISWNNLPITFACYACLLCLSASVLFAIYFVKGFTIHDVLSYNCHMVSLVFSCLATIAYLAEVSISRAQVYNTNRFGYMATTPGLLKVCETFVACFIFVFISNPDSYESHAAIKWCMAVYCICFILSIMVIILCVRNGTSWLSYSSSCVLSFYALLAAIMYLTATIIWPIYKFDKQHGGSILRPLECYSGSPSLCPFDKLIVVAVLTGVNFILYLVDLVYCCWE